VQALTKLLVIAAICIATLGVTAGATVGTTHAAPNTRFVQLTPHGRSAPAVATAVRRRSILYIKGRQRRFYISCYSPRRDPACDAGWVDPERGRWAFHLDGHTWVTGSESQTSEHYDAQARQRTPRRWHACCFVPDAEADIVRHGARHWDIYRDGSFVGYAKGLNGVAAGLMWLADPVLR
jgi:hypothetical protein